MVSIPGLCQGCVYARLVNPEPGHLGGKHRHNVPQLGHETVQLAKNRPVVSGIQVVVEHERIIVCRPELPARHEGAKTFIQWQKAPVPIHHVLPYAVSIEVIAQHLLALLPPQIRHRPAAAVGIGGATGQTARLGIQKVLLDLPRVKPVQFPDLPGCGVTEYPNTVERQQRNRRHGCKRMQRQQATPPGCASG